MTSSRHQRIGDIVHAALVLPPGERAALIIRECAGDGALRAEVESMLRAARDAGTFLDAPLVGPEIEAILAQSSQSVGSQSDSGIHKAGDQIGSLRIERFLDGGGMGEVYLAWQHQPRRRVALKVLRLGMDSHAVLARFRHEQQALAAMDHPNIAHVFDAGCTPPEKGGRPFFTMEYVDGEPITKYCDRHSLTNRQRLELFVPVCEAVQHAHRKGIIHRDLKPSNVLVAEVEGRPIPKVIDFGIAKAVDQTSIERTVYSMEGQFIGTPEYMSPEQASGQTDVDTRTDVYSLGVMLYELLVGRLPFDSPHLKMSGLNEALRIIREVEPPRPCTLFGNLGEAADRIASIHRLDRASMLRELRRELEWVPLKALRKERERRYDSPAALAEDIRRYLDGRPLSAAPESRVYLARKFVTRNRGPVAATIAVAAALAAATWALGRAGTEREQRVREENRSLQEQYHGAITNAQLAIEANDVSTARAQLDGAPAAARGWEWDYLRAATDDAILTLRPPESGSRLRAIALSSDGARLAAGLIGGGVLLWDLGRGTDVRRLIGPSGDVTQLMFSQDGRWLLAVGSAGAMRVWDAHDGGEKGAVTDAHRRIMAAAFESDGAQIMAACADGTTLVVEAPECRVLSEVGSIRQSTGEHSVRLSADRSRAVISGEDGSAEVWNLLDGQVLAHLQGRGGPGPMGIAALSADGHRIAQGWDSHIRLGETDATGRLDELEAHEALVTSIEFSPAGDQLLSTSVDATARLWSVPGHSLIQALRGHEGSITRGLFTPDGRHVLTISHDKTLRIWDGPRGQELARLRGHESELVYMVLSEDGAWAATSDLQPSIRIWDARRAAALTDLSVRAGPAAAAAFSDDGRRIAIPTSAGPGLSNYIDIWSVDKCERLASLQGHAKGVWSANFSHDGLRLITASDDKCASIWTLATQERLDLHHQDWVNWAEFSPDNSRVITACGDRAAHIWDAGTGREISRLEHPGKVKCATYARLKPLIATACDDHAIRLWDATGKEVRTLAGHSGPVIHVSFNAIGDRLVSASEDGTARVWDVDTGATVFVLAGHTKHVMSAQFSSDDSRIVTASWDQSVRIWSAASGRELVAFRDHHGWANWAIFSPDGNRLLTTYQDGSVLLRDRVPAADRFARSNRADDP